MKKIVSLLLVMIMLFSVLGCAYSENLGNMDVDDVEGDVQEQDILSIKDADLITEGLNSLGIMQGSEKGYELDKPLTRAEGVTLIVRLLAKNEEIESNKFKHPFTDVPKWAEKNISYMYGKKMTTGISKDTFGSDKSMSAKDFTTFILRVLRYNDDEDFTWETSLDKAFEIGLYREEYKEELESREFLRKDAAYIINRALVSNFKGVPVTIQTHLINNKILDVESLKDAYYLNVAEKVDNKLNENKQINRLAVRNSDFGELGDKLYGVVDNKLYEINGDKAKLINEYVETVYDYEGSLYAVIEDDGKGLYRIGANNSKSKVKSLDRSNLYKILGIYEDKLYYFTMDNSDYGIGYLCGDVESIDLKNNEIIKEAEKVNMWQCVMYDDMLFYQEYVKESYKNKPGIILRDLGNGKETKLGEGVNTGNVLKVDNKFFVNIQGEIFLYDLSTGERIKIQESIYGEIYAFYDGWLYFENQYFGRIVLKQNIYTGEIKKVYDGENIVGGFTIYKDRIYLTTQKLGQDKKLLYISDLDGKDFKKVGGM